MKTSTPPGVIRPADAARFAVIADECMKRARTAAQGNVGIGTLREKRLHAALKLFVSPDTAFHEQPIAELAPDNTCAKADKIADVRLADGHIFEIQTGGFYPLKRKIALYLAATDSNVTVVHPMAYIKYLSWLDPQDGTVLSRRKVSKRERVTDIAHELYWLSDFIGNPRFTLMLPFLEIEEYKFRNGWSRDGKRGASRYERFPIALHSMVTLKTPTDYAEWFVPASLGSAVFTAADYAKVTGIRGMSTYGTIHLMEQLGLIRETEEKVGRAHGYVRIQPPEQIGIE